MKDALTTLAVLATLSVGGSARAQVADGGVARTGGCVSDTLPADRAPTVTVSVEPPQPRVGDRVIVTYRFRYRSRDRVEFNPDVVAYQQPAAELEYARDQPSRDHAPVRDSDGWMHSDVLVAVQPFRVGEVTVAPQPARAHVGDEIARVCTPEVRMRVRSVFGNASRPAPRDITEPADVRRDALATRWAALALDGAFALICVTLALSAWMRSRPKYVAPPPPPRHPAVVALEGLDALRDGDLLSRGLTRDYYDAVSDVVRRYLGGMRDFDAIEMTTGELLAQLRKSPLPGVALVEVENLLAECDLVKFARYTPPHEEADAVLDLAYSLVRRGLPALPPPTPQAPTAEAARP